MRTTKGENMAENENEGTNATGSAAPAKAGFGRTVLAFINFEKNLMPYTMQILFVLIVIGLWAYGAMSLIDGIAAKVDNPNMDCGLVGKIVQFLLIIPLAPFVVHYALENLHYVLQFLKHLYFKVIVPLWEKLVLRFVVNVLPELFPFAQERLMKAVDICLDGLVVIFMAVAGLLKSVVWLPKMLGQYLEKWYEKMDK